MRVCSEPDCPTLLRETGRCPKHRRERDKRRGSARQRGYDTAHDTLRSQWAERVATGRIRCWRCTELIAPTEPWDLGHDDEDRTKYRGPEHANRCNRSAAGKKAHLDPPF